MAVSPWRAVSLCANIFDRLVDSIGSKVCLSERKDWPADEVVGSGPTKVREAVLESYPRRRGI